MLAQSEVYIIFIGLWPKAESLIRFFMSHDLSQHSCEERYKEIMEKCMLCHKGRKR